jgi:hypothetical protein
MSVSGFAHSADADPAAVRRRLDEWMAQQLTATYGVPSTVAKALVVEGWLLPVLDGIDEMDPDEGPPTRARLLLAALNLPTGPAPPPVLLTCRTARYHALADQEPLEDATAVVIRPLDAENVIGWLRHRFPRSGQPDGVERRWQPIVRRLRRHPQGRLARCLSNPLRLYLAVTVYQDRDSTPADLNRLDGEALEAHLLDRLVPAVTAHHQRSSRRHYRTDEVIRRLHALTRHLARTAAQGGSATDFHVHELWRSTSDTTVARAKFAGAFFAAGLCVPAVGWFLSGQTFRSPMTYSNWADLASSLIALIGVLWWSAASAGDPPKRISFRRFRVPLSKFLVFGLTFSTFYAVASLFQSVAEGGLADVTGRLAETLDAGVVLIPALLTAAVAFGAHQAQEVLSRPSDAMRMALYRDLYLFLVLVTGLSLAMREASGIAVVVATCVVTASSPWPRYLLALRAYHREGLLPWRLGHFLDWAHAAGILRLTGTAVQFRHRDLRRHLASPHDPS